MLTLCTPSYKFFQPLEIVLATKTQNFQVGKITHIFLISDQAFVNLGFKHTFDFQ